MRRTRSRCLIDLSVPARLAAVVEDLFELLRSFGKLPGAAFLNTLLQVATSLASPMVDAVGLARHDPAEGGGRIEPMKACFAEQGALAFWWVGARSQPPDFGRRLEEHGLTTFGASWPGTALEIDGLDARRLPPHGVSVSRVREAAEMRVWAETFCTAYEVPAFAGES